MIADAIRRLEHLCDTLPVTLATVDEAAFSEKESPDKWSRKEILGHLIDSATHNHHRLVRGQFEYRPETAYDQDKWVLHGFYQQIDRHQLIAFWTVYNKQLLALAKNIPQAHLQLEYTVGGAGRTLGFLLNDYVEHMEHHLRQIVSY